MASHVAWRMRSACHIIRRGYATEHQSTKSAANTFAEETFGSNVWRNAILVAIAGVAWYRIDQHITNLGEEKHPFTKWIEYHMNSDEETDRINESFRIAAEKASEYRLLVQEAERPPIYRMRYPEWLDSGSSRCLTAGLNADVSNVKVRSD